MIPPRDRNPFLPSFTIADRTEGSQGPLKCKLAQAFEIDNYLLRRIQTGPYAAFPL